MMYYAGEIQLRMMLHMDSGSIKRLGIYDAKELIDRAIVIKDMFEINMIMAPGILNPSELEQYSKYFADEHKETTEEEDLKEMEILAKAYRKMNGR